MSVRACQCVREAQGPTLLPTDITSALPSLPLSLHPSRCPTGSEPRSETSLRVAHTGTGCRRRNHPAAPSSESSRFGSVEPRPTHMDALSHTHTLHTAHTDTPLTQHPPPPCSFRKDVWRWFSCRRMGGRASYRADSQSERRLLLC